MEVINLKTKTVAEAIVIIIGAASIFIFWYMFNGFKAGTYTENTLLGSVYLEGLDESEVAELFGKTKGFKAEEPNVSADGTPCSVEDDDF